MLVTVQSAYSITLFSESWSSLIPDGKIFLDDTLVEVLAAFGLREKNFGMIAPVRQSAALRQIIVYKKAEGRKNSKINPDIRDE